MGHFSEDALSRIGKRRRAWEEEELKQAGRKYKVGKFPFMANGRANSLTVDSPSASRSKIALRVGSASAPKVASSTLDEYLTIWFTIAAHIGVVKVVCAGGAAVWCWVATISRPATVAPPLRFRSA
ncbi:MAG: hypothetical protein IH956_09155 [Chloroflexi bacterium]|nr:hypothetical protein [Chloroflexota bacterium]